jgi:hypothetical protein
MVLLIELLLNMDFKRLNRGFKPEPQKFPSIQFQIHYEFIHTDWLPFAIESVMPIEKSMLPPYR